MKIRLLVALSPLLIGCAAPQALDPPDDPKPETEARLTKVLNGDDVEAKVQALREYCQERGQRQAVLPGLLCTLALSDDEPRRVRQLAILALGGLLGDALRDCLKAFDHDWSKLPRLQQTAGYVEQALVREINEQLADRAGETKSSLFEHWRDLTNPVLREVQWGQPAIDLVVDCNLATDLSWLAEDWYSRIFVVPLFPNAREQIDRVERLIKSASFRKPSNKAAHDFHFDDLFSFSKIEKRWKDHEQWLRERASELQRGGFTPREMSDFLGILGITLHAIQDFYCHSNWVTLIRPFLPAGSKPDDYPTWEQFQDRSWKRANLIEDIQARFEQSNGFVSTEEGKGGLQTGAWSVEKTTSPNGRQVEPWEHRHPGGETSEVLLHLSRIATKTWVQKALNLLDSDNREALLKHVKRD